MVTLPLSGIMPFRVTAVRSVSLPSLPVNTLFRAAGTPLVTSPARLMVVVVPLTDTVALAPVATFPTTLATSLLGTVTLLSQPSAAVFRATITTSPVEESTTYFTLL